jgi:hypothetical protein
MLPSLTLILAALRSDPSAATTGWLAGGHAHNDYRHSRPLLDALDHGFCSVEADIFLVDGALLVGHDLDETQAQRTLQRLYLDPLRDRVKQNGGRVYAGGPDFTLLIDIKSAGEATYRVLHQVLAGYAEMLTTVRGDQVAPGAVTVIVSGNRAASVIARDSPRFVGIDGRLGDLDSNLPAHLMPLISDHWGTHFRWDGEGPMPAAQRERLHSVVQQAHQAGRRVRFWATPEKPAMWRELYDAGVDLINTDQLLQLREFLLETAQE